MNESDRRQRVISTTPRLSTDEVANRAFGRGVRGFNESEVRVFLKKVAEDLAHARERERELESAIDALEEQVRTPRHLSEQELLDALGEETARLLRSAREASDDIRKKAEERAATLVEEAAAAAERTRTEAAELHASRLQEADTKTSELVAAAEARATSMLDAANAEAEKILDTARVHGRDMLDEAKSARERVLGDLVRRRALLGAQIEALRTGRDRLLDAYRTVKRTFLDATEALAHVEARAAEERSASTGEVVDLAEEIAAEIEKLDAGEGLGHLEGAAPEGEAAATDVGADEVEGVELVGAGSATTSPTTTEGAADDAETAVETALADVDSLFARLRAGHEDDEPSDTPEGPRVSAAEWRAQRAQAIDPLLPVVLKRAKRRAQDDQSALLDAVRRHKGRAQAEQVLNDPDAALADWSQVVRDAVDRAYGAGRAAAGASAEPANDELARASAELVVAPLRERLTIAIDSGEERDTGGLVERIGARYREWKNQALERTLSEMLAAAWTRGVYDAVPDDAILWWVPFEEGRCSDCDDNALEPTVKGKQFPTGQSFPPAHPGCKCLLAPAGLLAGK